MKIILFDNVSAEACAAGLSSSAKENPAAEQTRYPHLAAHSRSEENAENDAVTAAGRSQFHLSIAAVVDAESKFTTVEGGHGVSLSCWPASRTKPNVSRYVFLGPIEF